MDSGLARPAVAGVASIIAVGRVVLVSAFTWRL
jgi:hypothetical protein